MVRHYETLLLFSPEMTAENLQTLLSTFGGIITAQGGDSLTVNDWGIKELAYPVKKQLRGHYVRLEYNLPALAVAELERNIRIADGVFKFVTVKLDDKAKSEEKPVEESGTAEERPVEDQATPDDKGSVEEQDQADQPEEA
jgi:small subunit ribosomal protein S6